MSSNISMIYTSSVTIIHVNKGLQDHLHLLSKAFCFYRFRIKFDDEL